MKIFPPLAKKFPLSSTSPFHRQVLSSASTCVSSGLSTNRISLSKMALLYRGESRKKILKHPVFWIKVMEIVSKAFLSLMDPLFANGRRRLARAVKTINNANFYIWLTYSTELKRIIISSNFMLLKSWGVLSK